MANKTYLQKLKDPRWQKKRLEVLNRDDWTCQLCGDKETSLQIHHKEYNSYNPWETKTEFLITYCEHCHSIVSGFNPLDKPVIKVVKRHIDNGNIAIYALHKHSNRPEVKFVSLYIVEKEVITLETVLFQFDIDIMTPLLNNANNG